MKKKSIIITAVVALILVMGVVLAACSGKSTDAPADTTAAETTAETTTETTTAAPAKDLELKTKYTTDDYEITFNDISFEKKAVVRTGSNSTTYQEASEGNVFVVMELSLKNIGTETVDHWDIKPFDATVVYNEKYNYSDYTVVADNEIQPLAEKTVCICVEVPESIEDAEESLIINFDIAKEEYVYTIR